MLILFGDPKLCHSKTKGAGGDTRSSCGSRGGHEPEPPEEEQDVEPEIVKFEVFLKHITFCLLSEKNMKHVRLSGTFLDARPKDSVLSHVDKTPDWTVVLSRFRFDVEPDYVALLAHEFNWTLELQQITRTSEFKYIKDVNDSTRR